MLMLWLAKKKRISRVKKIGPKSYINSMRVPFSSVSNQPFLESLYAKPS